LQLQELGGKVEASVETGEGERKRTLLMQLMGGSKLNAAVAAQGACLSKDTSLFNQRLGDLDDRKASPGDSAN
jgi:hypothetical protein